MSNEIGMCSESEVKKLLASTMIQQECDIKLISVFGVHESLCVFEIDLLLRKMKLHVFYNLNNERS